MISDQNDPSMSPAQNSQAMCASKGAETRVSTILAVDDEDTVLRLVARLLTVNGFRVFAANSAVAAVKVWREYSREIDLLLTDLVMPGQMSGRALAEQLQSEKRELKVLLTSGYDAAINTKSRELLHAVDFVQKPYSPDELLLAVRRALNEKGIPAQW